MTNENEFLQSAANRLRYYKQLAEKALEQVDEQGLHYVPGPGCNSIAVIMQHMAGNMRSRWTNFLTSDGEKDWRNRDAEFEEQQLNRQQLLADWQNGWDCCLHTLASLTAADVSKTIRIRTETLTVIDAINRQLAHYPYHVGQIICLAKILAGNAWNNLSIARGQSQQYNRDIAAKG